MLLFVGVCVLVGLALVVYGCVLGYQSYVLSRDGVTTQGRVVEVDSDAKTYYPVVEFWSAGEKQHRFTSSDGLRSVGDYKVGATVSVLYDPGNPANARLADAKQTWHRPLVFGLIWFMFLLAIGIVQFFATKSDDR